MFVQCNLELGNKEHQDIVNSRLKEEQDLITSENNTLYPEYIFKPKDTIYKLWEYGGKSVFIDLGICETNLGSYNAVTEFRLIPVTDGMRGRSTFYLISMEKDTMEFDAQMPEELPVDLYKNNFVFLNQVNEYSFGAINELQKEIVCFDGNHNGCFH